MSLLQPTAPCALPFARGLEAHGDRLAIATPERTLSYLELAALVEDTAARLGTGRRLVLLVAGNHLEALVWYLAALRGGHPILLVPDGDDAHVQRLLAAYDPDVVVTGGSSGWEPVDRRAGSAHVMHPDLAVLLCTSGSTGSAKVVRLSHRNLQANAKAIADYLRLTPDDVAATTLPMPYCYGLSVINSHLAAGAGLLLTDRSVVDRCFWDDVRRVGATSFAGVPHTFDLLDRVGFESMAVPSLRYVTQAGGRMAPERVERFAALGERQGWDLVVMYGQTEATARMAYLPPHLARTRPTAIGVPIPGGSFELVPVDEADDPTVGELVYRGDNVMLGYAESPADLERGATLDALRTGDLARRAPDGLVEIVGRRSRFAKVFGLRIDLEHLEALLRGHGIAALCTSDDADLVVAVEGADDEARLARSLVQHECGLPPSRVLAFRVAELPRLPNGKPDHAAVRARAGHAAEPAGPTAHVGPPHDVHPAVHHAIARVLHDADITGDDTFVGLGGDSMSYVEVSIALEEALGELPDAWPTTPLRDLTPTQGPARRATRLETGVVLRAVAIVLVVGTHIKLFNLLGGAHLLLAIAGFNYARFQAGTADRLRSAARIAVPSVVWLAVINLLDDDFHLSHVLLVNGWLGDDGHGGYWYVEAVLQILVPLAVLLAIPAVGRLERAHRLGFPMAVLAAGLAVRFHVVELPTVEPHDIRPHDILWIFAIGWAAGQARSARARWLLSALVVASVPGYFGEPQREVFVVVGMLLLLWVPTIPIPRLATRTVGAVAAASLYVYLTHWQVFPTVRDRVHPAAALVACLVVGALARAGVRAAGRTLSRRRTSPSSRVWRPTEVGNTSA